MEAASDQTWLRLAFRDSTFLGQPIAPLVAAANPAPALPDDPEKLEELRKLIEVIISGRPIVASYNIVVVLVLLGIAAFHARQKAHDVRRWKKRTDTAPRDGLPAEDAAEAAGSSSASSTVDGNTTPPYAAQDPERAPLLAPRSTSNPHKLRLRTKLRRAIRACIAYQPRPIPVVNRTLPDNATSFLVLAFIGINVFFHLFRLPLEPRYLAFTFADRAGLVFIANLPLLYLLAAKNQPIKLLTGFSYEALNIFHRRLGELLCFEALVHFVGMLLWYLWLGPEWLRRRHAASALEFFTHPLVLLGIGAFISYELIYFTSLGSFRQRWYEVFLATHVFLQVTALAFLFLHFHTSRPYVLTAITIFAIDRLIWRMLLKTTTVTADLHVFPDGETILLSANWGIPDEETAGRPWWQRWTQRSVRYGWRPIDHVFLAVPALGRSHSLQSHPFTIASAAPPAATSLESGEPRHAWLNCIIRAHSGFTLDLLGHAHLYRRADVRLDGPYGSSHALDMLRAADSAVIVAGGSGIAVAFPLLWALLMDPGKAEADSDAKPPGKLRKADFDAKQKVHLLWIVHSPEHICWISKERLDELTEAGLDVVIPQPTVLAGRPDVEGIVRGWIEDTHGLGKDTSIVVSGPDSLNRTVRNTCAEALGRGAAVRVAVEKFGW